MALVAITEYLQPDEETRFDGGRHMASILDAFVASTIFMGAVGGLVVLGFQLWGPQWFVPIGVPILILLGILYVAQLVAMYWRVVTSRYVVTNERVYTSHGRLRFFLIQTTFDKVTDLHVKQSLFGRWFGFGTVRLQTAGGSVGLEGVRQPLAVKQSIEAARSRFLESLVAEHGAAQALKPTPTQGPDDVDSPHAPDVPLGYAPGPLWTGGPVFASLLGSVASLLFMGLFGLVFLGRFVVSEGGGTGWLLVLLPVVIGLGLWSVWIRYRYTKYFVHADRVIVTSGWLTRRRVETTYNKVTDVTTYQGIMGRMFGFGSITINTAGSNEAPVIFAGIGRPDDVKSVIDQARGRRRRGGSP